MLTGGVALRRWWQWFTQCDDRLGLCHTNIDALQTLSGKNVADTLMQGDKALFSIRKASEDMEIPPNYFCQWSLDLTKEEHY